MFMGKAQIDKTHIHFKLTGNMMHQDSPDGKQYLIEKKGFIFASII